MMQIVHPPLKLLFNDNDYAWELLEYQIKLQTTDHISGEDVSKLLGIYMKGVQKMNQTLDYREIFFKNKLTMLMSTPTVMRALNNSMMTKKHAPAEAMTQKQKTFTNKLIISENSNDKKSSLRTKKLQNKAQLNRKRKQMQLRLVYESQQSLLPTLDQLMKQNSQKQTLVCKKVASMKEDSQLKLNKRINQRKLKAKTYKSLCNQITSGNSDLQVQDNLRNRMADFAANQEQLPIGKSIAIQDDSSTQVTKKVNLNKSSKSLSPKKGKELIVTPSISPLKRTTTSSISLHINHQSIKLCNFSNAK